ncbi:hypothetical protein SAMN05421504_1011081 [Amycolatopsis xylanica]|uniref:Acyl carrier protein n=1 Tax=Amycolatopsis xylanica TaxID=589385 RepID=A0A1H2V2E7_9PSEU|nr:hypothetical protein [Amycolatopsis xylanica]SDW62460.1 hypothetical protein SAMN05421504_1011081 [Amycolatopsis xylanica]
MTTDAGTRITAEQVRLLLSDPKIFPDLEGDDTELVLDSLGLVWFLHLLELRHGIALDPDDEHVTGVTSVTRITEGLANHG